MINITLFFVIYCGSSCWCAGLFFAQAQGRFPSIAKEGKKRDLGMSIMVGCLYGLLDPIGVGMAYLATGFGEYGWKLKS